MQIAADKISFYCFNSSCHSSVFYLKSIKIVDLTLDESALATPHRCDTCGNELVSLLNIEIKKTILDTYLSI